MHPPRHSVSLAPHVRVRMRQRLIHRSMKYGGVVSSLIVGAIVMGTAGYHYLEGLDWLDAALNAVMILTGMGPANPLVHPGAKVFAIFYSLFSGVFFLSMVAVLLAPTLHHFLHRFHL